MTVSIDIPPDIESRLRDLATAQGIDPTAGTIRVLIETFHVPRAAESEGGLLNQLDLGLSQGEWVHYRSLVAKRRDEVITPAELDELSTFTDRLEESNARRLTAVGKLAQMRGQTFEETFRELGLGPVGEPYDE